jgi:hypothetical protein
MRLHLGLKLNSGIGKVALALLPAKDPVSHWFLGKHLEVTRNRPGLLRSSGAFTFINLDPSTHFCPLNFIA